MASLSINIEYMILSTSAIYPPNPNPIPVRNIKGSLKGRNPLLNISFSIHAKMPVPNTEGFSPVLVDGLTKDYRLSIKL